MADKEQDMTAWIRWGVSIIIVLGGWVYLAGSTTEKVSLLKQEVDELKLNRVTRDQFLEMKSDVKEIKQDLKELSKGRK